MLEPPTNKLKGFYSTVFHIVYNIHGIYSFGAIVPVLVITMRHRS